ncbi:MAG: IS4 family transposase [Verrucomicrobiae bacterium]|nr:IS4 family transposase [Verrucomicrobiae bacterium]
MSTPDFPSWAGGFQRAYKKFHTPAQHSVHQLERLFEPWIPAWRLSQQDEKDFSRQRQWTLRLTFWCFLWQVAQAGSSCRDAVRQAIALCTSQGLPAPTDDRTAYCMARAKLPVERLEEIHNQVVQDAERRVTQGDLWCGRRVRALDGTCVTMADTPENQAVFPQSNTQKPGCGFPVARILASFCLATGMMVHWVTGHWYQHELSLLASLLECFSAGEVLLGDRGFGNFPVLAQCLARGLDGVFRANTAMRRLDFRRGKRLGTDDRLVVWHRGSQPRYMSEEFWAQLPDEITVRVVRVAMRVPGFRTRSVLLVTTLLDPVRYPPQALAELYLRRWEMELSFRHLKTTLQMEHLSCKSPAMIDRELRLHFLSHNLVRRVALEAARRHLVPLQRISFKGTLGAVHTFAEACLRAPSAKRRQRIQQQLYKVVAADLVPERPGRREPRAVKRRPKPYPLLTAPRRVYREIPHKNRYRRSVKSPSFVGS